MLKLWVLLIAMETATHKHSSIAVIQQEFNSLESCQQAMKAVVQQYNKNSDYGSVVVRGCYEK